MSTPRSVAQAIEQKKNPPYNPNEILAESIAEQQELLRQLVTGLPATEVHFGTTPPESPVHGDLWYHSDENRLYVYVVE